TARSSSGTNLRIASHSPSTSIHTPCPSLRMNPPRPSARARRCTAGRKPTPCTVPRIRIACRWRSGLVADARAELIAEWFIGPFSGPSMGGRAVPGDPTGRGAQPASGWAPSPCSYGVQAHVPWVHELAVMEDVIAMIGERLGPARVTRVRLEVGRLAGAVPDALRLCFDICSAATPLEGARLELIEVPARGHCQTCAMDFEPDGPIALCSCGSAEVEIVGGYELRIKDVEVA